MARTRGVERKTRSPTPAQAEPTPTKSQRARRGSSAVPTKNQGSAALVENMSRKRGAKSQAIDEEQDAVESSQQTAATVSKQPTSRASKRAKIADAVLPTPPATSTRTTSLKQTVQTTTTAATADRSSPLDSSPPYLEQRHFTPLREALDRSSRHTKRHYHLSEEVTINNHDTSKKSQLLRQQRQHIEELEDRVEQQRVAAVQLVAEGAERDAAMAEVKDLQSQIIRLKQDQGHFDGADTQEVEMQIEETEEPTFIAPQDLGVTQQDLTPRTSFVSVTTTKRIARQSLPFQAAPAVDPAVRSTLQSFEAALKTKSEQIADLQSTIEFMTIELRSLGFSTADADYQAILVAVRSAFQQARERVNGLLGEQDLNELENDAFLQLLCESMGSSYEEIETYTVTIEELRAREKHLAVQTEVLLETISTYEQKIEDLRRRFSEADTRADAAERDLIELQAEYDELTAEFEERGEVIKQNTERIGHLEKMIAQLEVSLEQSRVLAQKAQIDLSTARDAFARQEMEYQQEIESIRITLNATIDTLRQELNMEINLKEDALEKLEVQIALVQTHQATIKQYELELEQLNGTLIILRTSLQEQTTAREDAESEVEERDETIATLQGQVTVTEAQIVALKKDLIAFQTQLEAQKRQREEAENSLDEANEIIVQRDGQIKILRNEAQELRLKLFGAQQEHEKLVQQLNDRAIELDEQYQTDMSVEIERRESAEKRVAELQLLTVSLQDQIDVLQQQVATLVTEKDTLEREHIEEVENLTIELQDVEAEFEAYKKSSEERISALTIEIRTLTDKLGVRDTLIRHMEAEKVDTAKRYRIELANRDTQIQELTLRIEETNILIVNLNEQKSELEQRMAADAADTTAITESLNEQITTLTERSAAYVIEISGLKKEMTRIVAEHTLLIESKTREIESLTIISSAREEDIRKLFEQNDWLKMQIRKLVSSRDAALKKNQKLLMEVYGRAQEAAEQMSLDGETVVISVDELEVIPRHREVRIEHSSQENTRVVRGAVRHAEEEVREATARSSPFRSFTSFMSGSVRGRKSNAAQVQRQTRSVASGRASLLPANGETEHQMESADSEVE